MLRERVASNRRASSGFPSLIPIHFLVVASCPTGGCSLIVHGHKRLIGIGHIVPYVYFPFRDKLFDVFLGRIAEEERPLMNAVVSLVVDRGHVCNFGGRIKRAGATRGVNLSLKFGHPLVFAISNEPEQRPQ